MIKSLFIHIGHSLHDHFVHLYENLSEHPVYGMIGGLFSWIIYQIPVTVEAQYQNTTLHLVALYIKDFGMIATGLLAILSLFFLLKKHLYDPAPKVEK